MPNLSRYNLFLIVLIFVTLLIRLYNLSFPAFTSDETRIAYRGYTLAATGKDELGRSFPILFNSLTDYQLPVVSYMTALGVLIFGKTDLAARAPFILTSLLIVIIIFKVSKIFNLGKEFRILSALLVVFTPAFIYLSKIPNEGVVLTFSLVLLFYLLTKKQVNFFIMGGIMVFALATSKIAWWVLVPFIAFILIFFQKDLLIKTKIMILIISFLLTIFSVGLFLQVPQAERSLWENDFPIFKETNIRVATDRLRGQGLEANWPNILEKIIFNRFQFILMGMLNWINNLQPAILFGQFDQTGMKGFIGMGAFPKITLLPFIVGLISITRKKIRSLKFSIFFPLLLTSPLFFVYPNVNLDLIIIFLPFLIFIIALGLTSLNRFLKYLCITLIIFEIFINIIYLAPDIKIASNIRSVWIKKMVADSYNLSLSDEVAISDNLALDLAPFLGWYASLPIKDDFKDVRFPYKFRQMIVSNINHKIRLIGSDDSFYFCGLDKPTYIFASNRDLAKIKKWLNIITENTVTKIYEDDLSSSVAYLLRPTICVH